MIQNITLCVSVVEEYTLLTQRKETVQRFALPARLKYVWLVRETMVGESVTAV